MAGLGSVNGQHVGWTDRFERDDADKKGTAPQLAVPAISDGLLHDATAETRLRDVTKQAQRSDRRLPVRFLHTSASIGLISVCDTPDTPMLQSACNPAASRLRTEKSLKMDL